MAAWNDPNRKNLNSIKFEINMQITSKFIIWFNCNFLRDFSSECWRTAQSVLRPNLFKWAAGIRAKCAPKKKQKQNNISRVNVGRTAYYSQVRGRQVKITICRQRRKSCEPVTCRLLLCCSTDEGFSFLNKIVQILEINSFKISPI